MPPKKSKRNASFSLDRPDAMRFYRGVEGRQDMPDYLNTEPNPQKPGAAEAIERQLRRPQKPGAAEAIERLQVALRHLRAAKLALTDLSYAPACEAVSSVESLDDHIPASEEAMDSAVLYLKYAIEELGGKPDMESHYSGRQQAEALQGALVLRQSITAASCQVEESWHAGTEKLRQMAEMAWRMA